MARGARLRFMPLTNCSCAVRYSLPLRYLGMTADVRGLTVIYAPTRIPTLPLYRWSLAIAFVSVDSIDLPSVDFHNSE